MNEDESGKRGQYTPSIYHFILFGGVFFGPFPSVHKLCLQHVPPSVLLGPFLPYFQHNFLELTSFRSSIQSKSRPAESIQGSDS